MPTLTPNMDLELPDIVVQNSAGDTVYTLGTLPQDWALLLNFNIVTVDEHDHALLGAQIPSIAMTATNLSKDMGFISIEDLSYVTFSAIVTAMNVSMYSDGTDLFWQDSVGQKVQLTIAHGLNPVLSTGGFFGQYASSGAIASIDGPKGYYRFYSGTVSNPDSAVLSVNVLQFNTTDATLSLNTLAMQSGTSFSFPPNLTIKSPNYFNRFAVTRTTSSYTFTNVVGDGSNYAANANVPITDPNGIFNTIPNPTFPYPTLNNNILVNQAIDQSNGQNDQIEMFGMAAYLSLIDDDLFFTPGETKTYKIFHSFPLMAKIPHWGGTFSVNLSKWSYMFPASFISGVGVNPLYKNFIMQITSVTWINDGTETTNRDFNVVGTVTNISNTSVILPKTTKLESNLRIAAIFPLFNGEGVFFGPQY